MKLAIFLFAAIICGCSPPTPTPPQLPQGERVADIFGTNTIGSGVYKVVIDGETSYYVYQGHLLPTDSK
jgi:hypothetical protein